MGEKGKRKRNKWDGERKIEESNGKENVKTRGGSRSGEGRTSEDTKKGEGWRDNWERTHTHSRLTALYPGLPRWAGIRKVKPI